MLSFRWLFSHGRLLVRLSKLYKKGTSAPHQVLLLHIGVAELHESTTSSSQDQVFRIEGSERTLGRLYYDLYFSYLLAILMLTSRSLWGKAFVVTINNKYLCSGQWLQISILWLFKFSLHRVALDWGSIKYNLDYASLCIKSVFLNKTST